MLWNEKMTYLAGIKAMDSMYTCDEAAVVAELETQVDFFVSERDSIEHLARE